MKKGLIKLFLLIVFAVSASLLIFYNAERAKKVEVVGDYLIAQNELEDIISKDTNYNFQNPKIIVNPYENSPLTALIIFETNDLLICFNSLSCCKISRETFSDKSELSTRPFINLK